MISNIQHITSVEKCHRCGRDTNTTFKTESGMNITICDRCVEPLLEMFMQSTKDSDLYQTINTIIYKDEFIKCVGKNYKNLEEDLDDTKYQLESLEMDYNNLEDNYENLKTQLRHN